PPLVPARAEEGHVPLPGGDIKLEADRLLPGERRTFGMEARCTGPSNGAFVRFTVTADGVTPVAMEKSVEILPPISGAEPGGAASAGSDLRLSVGTNTN